MSSPITCLSHVCHMSVHVNCHMLCHVFNTWHNSLKNVRITKSHLVNCVAECSCTQKLYHKVYNYRLNTNWPKLIKRSRYSLITNNYVNAAKKYGYQKEINNRHKSSHAKYNVSKDAGNQLKYYAKIGLAAFIGIYWNLNCYSDHLFGSKRLIRVCEKLQRFPQKPTFQTKEFINIWLFCFYINANYTIWATEIKAIVKIWGWSLTFAV